MAQERSIDILNTVGGLDIGADGGLEVKTIPGLGLEETTLVPGALGIVIPDANTLEAVGLGREGDGRG